jgi:hypothetical protein
MLIPINLNAQMPGTPVQQVLTSQNPYQSYNPHHHQHQQYSTAATATTVSSAVTPLNITESTPVGGGGAFTPKQNLMETPLLYYNSVSTPMSGIGCLSGGGLVFSSGGGLGFSSGGAHITGISSLNLTDSENSKPAGTGLMPPPVRYSNNYYISVQILVNSSPPPPPPPPADSLFILFLTMFPGRS